MREDLVMCKSECEVVMRRSLGHLRIEFSGENVLKVIDQDNYTKLEAFKPEFPELTIECTGFIVSIQVAPLFESIKH